MRSVTYGERHVVIDWRVSYVFRFVPAFLHQSCAVTLPLLTVLTMDEDGLILHHDDHWSLHEVIGGVPLLGLLYRGAKRVTGKASSVATNLLWTLFAAGKEAEAPACMPIIASPSSTIMGSLGSAAPPSDAPLAASSADRSARGISSGTITSVGTGPRSSVGSGGVPEEDKTLLAASD